MTRTNGRTISVKFDRTGIENLYIRFNVEVIGGGVIDRDNLKVLIVENVTYEIGESASTDKIVCYVKDLNQKYRITGAEISADNVTWSEVVAIASIQNKFVLDVSRITIS